jgi:hypothetical protein
MKNNIFRISLSVIALSMTQNCANAQGWQGQTLNRLIAINQFDNTAGTATGNSQVTNIHVGVGTDAPDASYKMQIYSSTQDSHMGISGVAPSLRFSDNVLWSASTVGQADFGLATVAHDFVANSVPGDFILQNRKNNNLILASGGGTGVERMRIAPNGFVGINTTIAPHVGGNVLDRLDVALNAGEFVRIENMPTGVFDPVVIDPSGRLYRNTTGTGTGGLFWSLTGNTVGTNPYWLGTIDNKDMHIRTNSKENITIVPQPAGGGDVIGGTCNVGINTANAPGGVPYTGYKLQVWSNENDQHIGVSGASPSIRFSNAIDWTVSGDKADIGLATRDYDFVHYSVPGDFVMQNRNPKNSIIFGTNSQIKETPIGEAGAERMRIDQNGYVGINTVNNLVALYGAGSPAGGSGVKDRVEIYLSTPASADDPAPQEYVRIDNMPAGEFHMVTIDPTTGRLYMSGKTTGAAPGEDRKADELQGKVTILENEIASLKSKLDDLSNAASLSSKDAAQPANSANILYQNTPNPFSRETTIGYLVNQMSSGACIMISDMNGKELMRVPVTQTGKGSVNINSSNLAAGMYLYTLIVDGNATDSKKMIVSAQ